MAELLLEKKLRTTENKEVRNVARTRTLAVLRTLDGTRKGIVLRFLKEAGLIDKEKTIVDLEGADLIEISNKVRTIEMYTIANFIERESPATEIDCAMFT